MHCFDFSKSYNNSSFPNVHLFKTKITKAAEQEPYQLIVDDGWLGFALHTCIGLESYELHFCTMRMIP